ncbi:hypothetical protein L202_01456 [Cryptococcus amylolentus CBS 6039]|uniref:Uncharacterized protein n=2 Tax=Cryptococcus amylolentus TaxID=104669 RepID=A0A1E3I4H8_9TREE|nr:hypothetical protein L202_01456 [Cryptococcus amylolentus CBS 6039]ODN83285.1 hypothetical protein L202_01456 [Cryptococcus amylolentus CBS 6039]ODO10842.1 hypothetical protein I350_01441 [Cryptococcus amylolentus CBS 6273]
MSSIASASASIPQPPAPAYIANRRSTASIRRKPVTVTPTSPEFALELSNLSEGTPSGSTPPTPEPPVYILPVDPTPTAPSPESPETPTQPPAYSGNARPQYPYDLSLGSPSDVELTSESLPIYEEESTMEPKTLAKTLWQYGFVCPLLWLIGMTILWIPLRPVEDEVDPERAQKLEEMIEILRRTELKYAKRCIWAFCGFSLLIALIVVVAVVVSTR